MKALLLFPLIILSLFTMGQSDTALSVKEVVTVDSMSKTQLYENARLWFTDYFVSSKAVLQVADKEGGELIGKGILKAEYSFKYFGKMWNYPLDLTVTVKVNTKDGKYKYEVYDWRTEGIASNTYGKSTFGLMTSATECPNDIANVSEKKEKEMWTSAVISCKDQVNKLTESLKTYMNKKEKSEW